MSRMDTFIDITVRVEKSPTNELEGDGWIPNSLDVAAEIRDRIEDVDLGTGWIIAEVSNYCG